MRYSNPITKKTAQRIPVLCGLLFVCFSFVFLHYFQRSKLAQTQFLLSGGLTIYRPLLSAVAVTLGLTLLGILIDRLLRHFPLRFRAVSWYVPFMVLGIYTDRHMPLFGDIAPSGHWWVYVLLALLFLVLLLIGTLFPDSSKEKANFSTYAWPNVLQLLCFAILCVSVSNTRDSVHRMLRSNEAMANADYEMLLDAARFEFHPSPQLSSMTAWALYQRGELAERLFDFPHPTGSAHLLPSLQDSLLTLNLPASYGHLLGYRKGDRIATTKFLEIIQEKPDVRQPAARDFLLAAYLLDRRLHDFILLLSATDSLPSPMPRAYAEALVQYAALHPEQNIECLDTGLALRFLQFEEMRHSPQNPTSLFELFGTTYWYYYYFDNSPD